MSSAESAPGQSPSLCLSPSSPSRLPCIPLALPVPLCTVFPLLPLFLFGRAVAVFECPLHVWPPLSSLPMAPIPVSPHLPTSSPLARRIPRQILVVLLGVLAPLAPPRPLACRSPRTLLLPVPSPICRPRSARPPGRSTRAALTHLALCPWVASYFASFHTSQTPPPPAGARLARQRGLRGLPSATLPYSFAGLPIPSGVSFPLHKGGWTLRCVGVGCTVHNQLSFINKVMLR